MKALIIAGVNLQRLFRQRSSYFFLFVFPALLILLVGATFGGSSTPVIGVHARDVGPLGEQLVASLEATEDLDVKRYESEDGLLNAVERGRIQAGLVVPAGYDATLRAGEAAAVRFYGRPGSLAQQLRSAVAAVVGEQSALVRAARFAESEAGVPAAAAFDIAAAAIAAVPGVQVRTTRAGESLFPEDFGRFETGASRQLLLFVFVMSLSGSVALIETRRLGVSRRMLSTPTPVGTILAGEALGRLAVALLQGLIIMVGAALVFGVSWGDPLGAALVLVVFCLVGAGAGMLLGSVFENEQQAGAVALLLGLGLAALGGSMAPLEVFPETMKTIAHVTPHAWGNDAFAELTRRAGGVADILPQLGVLAGFATVLLALATWRLRKAITR